MLGDARAPVIFVQDVAPRQVLGALLGERGLKRAARRDVRQAGGIQG